MLLKFMTLENVLLQNKKLIFETFKAAKFDKKFSVYSDSLTYKEVCLDKTKDEKHYKPHWDQYMFKEPIDNESIFNNSIFKDIVKANIGVICNQVRQLFLLPEVYQVFYFEVWGEVLEHIDFNGYKLGYKTKNYNTLLMPIQIPKTNTFKTFYNKKKCFLTEGEFMKWKVSSVPHSWKYPISKDNELFKLLHIDYQ